jgi:hypothetical protein
LLAVAPLPLLVAGGTPAGTLFVAGMGSSASCVDIRAARKPPAGVALTAGVFADAAFTAMLGKLTITGSPQPTEQIASGWPIGSD